MLALSTASAFPLSCVKPAYVLMYDVAVTVAPVVPVKLSVSTISYPFFATFC